MHKEEIYRQMAESVVDLDLDKAKSLATQAISTEMDLLEVIEKGFGEGIRKVGDLWDAGEFFLPELMRGAQIMQEAVEILSPELQKRGSERRAVGKVVIATIEGDIHSIGKTIVATMLRANGFEVIDLGTDIPADKIVEVAIENDADIIGVSALLTTTMVGQKKAVEILEEKGGRDKIKILLGGAPVTVSWVEECKADGFAENAVEAISAAKTLIDSS